MTVATAAWAFVWSLATRVAQGHFRYLGHFAATALCVAVVNALEELVAPGVVFVFRLGYSATFWSRVVSALLPAGWLLFQHLSRVTSMTQRRCAQVSLAMALGVFALAGLTRYNASQKYSAELRLDGKALPPVFLVGPAAPGRSLAEALPALEAEVNALAAQR